MSGLACAPRTPTRPASASRRSTLVVRSNFTPGERAAIGSLAHQTPGAIVSVHIGSEDRIKQVPLPGIDGEQRRCGNWPWCSRSFAFQAADAQRVVGALGRRGVFEFLDVALRIAVDNWYSLGGAMLGHELAVLPPERFTKADGGMAAEV